MFPFIFEWIWDMAHMVFMGGLWFALTVIGIGLVYCIIRAVLETVRQTGDSHH